MNCREFQKIIPQILNNELDDKTLADVLVHVESCKECYDELEIFYVMKHGFDDNNSSKSMNFVGQLDEQIKMMKERSKKKELKNTVFSALHILANTSVIASLIYTIFYIF